jgi:hypothetical protein
VIRAVIIAALLIVAVGRPAQKPTKSDVVFAVALRTFEAQSVALADQAIAQSSSPTMNQAARELASDGNEVAAALWAWMDAHKIAGADRLPQATPGSIGPSAGLHHACSLVTSDELGRLAVLTGTAFDQDFARDWIAHADAAFAALAEETGMHALVSQATTLLHRDVTLLATSWSDEANF